MQRDMKKKNWVIIALAVVFCLIGMLFGQETEKEENPQKIAEENEEEVVVTDEPYPVRKDTEYRANTDNSRESYRFVINNMEWIDEESEFPQKQIEPVMNAIQEYLDINAFGSEINEISIAEETVYYYQDKFGMDICLNNEMFDYVKVIGEGNHIVCQDDNYGEPPTLTEEDAGEIARIHKKMYTSYLPDIVYDFEDFPYSKQDMETLIHSYYEDMSENYYKNYIKYGKDVQKYMEKELDYFHYDYSTYKYNTALLKKELANGNEEMRQYGNIKASVKGYMQLYSTNIVAKVELTMLYKKQKEQKMVWVTLIHDGNKLLILPEDRSVEEYWEYKYQY